MKRARISGLSCQRCLPMSAGKREREDDRLHASLDVCAVENSCVHAEGCWNASWHARRLPPPIFTAHCLPRAGYACKTHWCSLYLWPTLNQDLEMRASHQHLMSTSADMTALHRQRHRAHELLSASASIMETSLESTGPHCSWICPAASCHWPVEQDASCLQACHARAR